FASDGNTATLDIGTDYNEYNGNTFSNYSVNVTNTNIVLTGTSDPTTIEFLINSDGTLKLNTDIDKTLGLSSKVTFTLKV
ncbi:MAG: hypothetical protein RSC27_04355, partial [Bacilli bacterium]